mmetsp:Transcript_17447/g.32933  ORF Transcript_17447/g.32933 Transcript_17447/m.32933 type:complete len:410 (-) Transcript_17447:35-1264(-)
MAVVYPISASECPEMAHGQGEPQSDLCREAAHVSAQKEEQVPAMQEVVVDMKANGERTFRVPAHLEFIRNVGSGAYGSVAAFKDTRDNKKIAIKQVARAFDCVVDGKRILREVKLLRHFKHENILKILDLYRPESRNFEDIYIVTELMEADLHKVIYSKQTLDEEHHQWFMHQLLRGLCYIHAAGVVHRDLTPKNLLVNRACDLKICDFGLARRMSTTTPSSAGGSQEQITDYVVTRWYRAPEVVLLPSQYTEAIDIWAAGCIHVELIARRVLFPGQDYLDQVKKIINVLGTPTEEELQWLRSSVAAQGFVKRNCPAVPRTSWQAKIPQASPAAVEVFGAMLRFEPATRPSAQEALRLPYFQELVREEDFKTDMCVEPIDWAFDDFQPTRESLQELIYNECLSYHPEGH